MSYLVLEERKPSLSATCYSVLFCNDDLTHSGWDPDEKFLKSKGYTAPIFALSALPILTTARAQGLSNQETNTL